MASIPSTSSDAPAEDLEKPQRTDESDEARNVQYDESLNMRARKETAVQKQSRWKVWGKWKEGQKRYGL